MPANVKICGLKTTEHIEAAYAAGADYVGFVDFAPSPRHLPLIEITEKIKTLPSGMASVIVTVDPSDDWLKEADSSGADYIQLHGKETPRRISEIRTICSSIKLVKALAVSNAYDLLAARQYEKKVDMLLFDAKPSNFASPGLLPGGNGITFDWAILAGFESSLPWFLSGGLDANNVSKAIQQSGARYVDVSSGVESAAGVKDTALITEFLKAAKA